MTATATIENLMCVNPATGTDLHPEGAFAGLFDSALLASLAGPLSDVVKSIPGIVEAIDRASAFPDELFVTIDNSTKLAHGIWPGGEQTVEVGAGQSVAPNLAIDVPGSVSVSLCEDDVISADLLGAVTIFESERGEGEIVKMAKSDVEASIYYVTYRVD
ncbi:hypothetical protein GCM10022221_13560 [Actinocorallia aurea]